MEFRTHYAFWVFFIVFFAMSAGFAFMPQGAHAATSSASLYVDPVGGSFMIGSTFTVSLFLNTGGQSINAIEANLSFPPDKLQVVSPSGGKSFLQIWTAQPTYSNEKGTMQFQGVVRNPGITTNAGLISTVTFRAKSTGTAGIKFSDTSRVLLNDGKGTNVLGHTAGGIYYLTLPPPEGPIITSRTNPDQEKWYESGAVVFEWTAPPDIQGYNYILDDSPVTVPDDASKGIGTRVAYNDLSDGVHYFHLKALRQGVWGGVTDYVVKIDRTLPADFTITVNPSSYTSSRVPVVSFQTTDNLSGVDHYEIKVTALDKNKNNATDMPFAIETTSPYISNFDVGRYAILVRAYDVAGNYAQAQTTFTIINPIFEILGAKGIRLWGTYLIPWPYAIIATLLLLILAFYVFHWLWDLHVKVEEYFRHGRGQA